MRHTRGGGGGGGGDDKLGKCEKPLSSRHLTSEVLSFYLVLFIPRSRYSRYITRCYRHRAVVAVVIVADSVG